MNTTDIEWCDRTWNPITGCLHECPYCYARGIARRFGGSDWEIMSYEGECYDCGSTKATGEIHELYDVLERVTKSNDIVQAAYPFYFDPTFHSYRIDEPQKDKTPRNIFVGSMSDVFGDWVPDEWIKKVFDACEAAPWHRYMFLTKNPKRYIDLSVKGILPQSENMWFGSTTEIDTQPAFYSVSHNTFVSIEPIMSSFEVNGMAYGYGSKNSKNIDWVIIGAETGSRKNKIIPEREWIENIVDGCREAEIPVFMKNSLADIWSGELIQEYPWQ